MLSRCRSPSFSWPAYPNSPRHPAHVCSQTKVCIQNRGKSMARGTAPKLEDLSPKERGALALKLLNEQVLEQRLKLRQWRELTHQPAHIDTGYVGQHLVSIVTGLSGEGFRGK